MPLLPIVLPDEPPGRWRRLASRLLVALGAAVVLGGGWLLLGGGDDFEPAAWIQATVAGMSTSIRFGSSPATEGTSTPAGEVAAAPAEDSPPDGEASAAPTEDSTGRREALSTPREALPAPVEASPAPRQTTPADAEATPARRGYSPARREDSRARTEEAAPARGEASSVPAEFNQLLQAAERSIVGYQQRQSDFDLTRIGCYELAAGYARLDADIVSLAVWRSGVEGSLTPRQEAAYQEVMRRAAAADRLFDGTGCPRP